MKVCSKCKNEKSTDGFSANSRYKDGVFCWCKTCVREYAKINKDKMILAKKRYRTKPLTKEKRAVYGKTYRNQDAVKIRTRMVQKEWKKRNINKYHAICKRYYNDRSKNYLFKLETSMRVSMYKAMKKNGISKNHLKWEYLSGFTTEQLKRHLESKFTEGMSWNNYGKWHIDHIIPVSFFKYNSPDDVEFKMCWRLENLQPMWAKENLIKSNKLIA